MIKRILVTGAFGQIGSELVPELQKQFGKDNVVALGHHNVPEGFDGIVETAEISDLPKLEELISKYQIDTVFHLVSILSAKGEQDPSLTWQVNMEGLKNILDLAVKHKLSIFWPSTIAAFGPSTPKDMTPQQTVMDPTTMYGVTKVSGELLISYYHQKYGIDVRSVRYPGVISWKTPPGGGTSDYAVAIFYEGLQKGSYECFVGPETTIPMMYMSDCIKATIDIMKAEPEKVKIGISYNVTAMSFSAQDLAKEIQKHIPLTVTYKPDYRQTIADSWPKSLDDSWARTDWGWQPEIDLAKMTEDMLKNLKVKLTSEEK